MFISSKIEKRSKSQNGLYALDVILKDELIIKFDGVILDHPTRTSLQIGIGRHLEGPGEIDDFLNHSCNANGYIDFGALEYRALRAVGAGEELTFNYLTTEWDMASPFDCQCGSSNCKGFVRGFKYLTRSQQDELLSIAAPYLRELRDRG